VRRPVKPPRRYDASGRQAAAARTREAVLTAAREVFLDRGYTATTMAAISQHAGVALDTVYAAIGRKPTLFRELVETAISGQNTAVPAEERDYVRAIRAEPDPRRKLDIYAAAIAPIQDRLAPLVALARDAASAEPELARLWGEIAARRAANMRLLAVNLAESGGLRVEVEEAADVIWATNSPELYLLLVRDRGWELSRYRSWLAETWKRLLLA
jgi:AcrR family transcriptional regulator